jgi:hypothetical protein
VLLGDPDVEHATREPLGELVESDRRSIAAVMPTTVWSRSAIDTISSAKTEVHDGAPVVARGSPVSGSI